MAPRTWISLAAAGLVGTCLVFLSLRPCESDAPSPETASHSVPSGSAKDYAHTVRAYRIASERPDLQRSRELTPLCS